MTIGQKPESNNNRAAHMDEERCWQAVLNRELLSDFTFYYGVRSTGIYCRPTCPSKRPHREQVRFFTSVDSAVRAGFRPCLRCHPNEADPQTDAMLRVCRYIETHLDETLDLNLLGEKASLSSHHFQRVFRRIIGVTPRRYADTCRLKSFKAGLKDGENITAAMVSAGYGSTSRLYERTNIQLGMTPTAYRKGGEQVGITFTTTETQLGHLLAAATERGVCAVSLGDSSEMLEAALRAEYPSATIEHDDEGLQMWVNLLVSHLEGRLPKLSLPLDVRATAFQRQVWEAL